MITDDLREKLDMTKRPDRVGQYLKKYLDEYLFANFGAEYLAKSSLNPSFAETPIPLKKEDLAEFAGGKGMTPDVICENMVWVMGVDPHFRYVREYKLYINTMFDRRVVTGMLQMAKEAAEKEDYDSAFVHARAALILEPYDLDAMYSYARITQSMYEDNEDQEMVGRFKAESMEYFEMLTIVHPDFPRGHYHLGYAYINLGLYAKAQKAWQEFLRLSDPERDRKERQEIRERLAEVEEPVAVEAGCNEAMAVRFESAIEKLEPFLTSRFKSWWPLHYYLGVCYIGVAEEGRLPEAEAQAMADKAKDSFKKVLRLNPSHLETLNTLAAIYAGEGDGENAYKYSRKARIVAEGFDEDE